MRADVYTHMHAYIRADGWIRVDSGGSGWIRMDSDGFEWMDGWMDGSMDG